MKDSVQPLLAKLDRELDADQEHLKMLLIGSAEWIVQTIHHLHSVGFANVGDWSPVLPMANSTDLMSILVRSRA